MSSADQASCERLMQLARTGDAGALGQLLGLYRTYLKLLARLQISRRLQGRADPSDLVQEAFLEANQSFGRFHGTSEGELVAWLRQIMATKISDFVRRHLGAKCRDARLERDAASDLDQSSRLLEEMLTGGESSPSQRAARRELSVLLADALERLPDHYREVLILRHLEGISFPEIARRMGRSVDSVKNVWTRALVRLRRSLGGLS